MGSSRIETILRSLNELSTPVRVTGALPGARALIIAHRALSARRPILVLCPDDDQAAQLLENLETLSRTILKTPLRFNHFPNWEQSLYSPVAPSLVVRFRRAAVLSDLAGSPPDILVTTLAAASQATISKEQIQQFSLAISRNASIGSRETFIRSLLDGGYLRTDTVEDPGTFAVRGELIDVFPPGRERPIRIELFDQDVERIREYDADTQRTISESELQTLRIGPAREVLINPSTVPRLREQLKAYADDHGVPRTVRDPILASVQEGFYAEHSEGWAPFAYDGVSTLWDHLPTEVEIVWDDETGIQQSWDSFLEEQEAAAKEAATNEVLAPAPAQLFLRGKAIDNYIQSHTRLFLDRFEMADLSAVGKDETPPDGAPAAEAETPAVRDRHRVVVLGNSDLSGGSRHSLGELEPKFQLWKKQGFQIVVLAPTESQRERMRFLLNEHHLATQTDGLPQPGLVTLAIGTLSEGFRWPAEGLVLLLESEILGSRPVRRSRASKSASKEWSGLQALSDLSSGDYVVHIDHGIGRYQGIVRLDLSGAASDFLLLEYANNDKLYLPVYRLNAVQKYVGAGESVSLDRLGSQHFAKSKERVKEAVRKLAIDLVQLYAERKVRTGLRFSPRDSLFREFEAKFPFDETPDQLKAIDAVLEDLESGKVMDRLICGDVGYGKTEVAIRAAFRAVTDGKQVAVLVPTTVLAQQHAETFCNRLKDYPITVESLSRFKTAKQQKEILAGLAAGKVDIVIGTHRLLSRDIKFHDLGLIIVDEEHRFGVEHKERLKTIKLNTPVLTLTATPIPRTLHMALSGLRDISLINTAPVDRVPIRTYVAKFDEALIKKAVEFELSRGGQVFFVHNRVQSIHDMASRLRELVPQAKIMVAHGQMSEHELEKAMLAFYHKQANVLVCTAIIESGLDLPSANTIIVNRADAFGLAQLYQIRGRVGRAQQRAYAYLLLPAEGTISEDAKRRIEVIQRFVELGSGFSIASHDLEIRGGGDLLGPQQSGHIAAVGFDLYTELLEEAIREIQGRPVAPEESRREPEIKVPFPAFLSEAYIPDAHQRLSLYRRFSASNNEAELDSLEQELQDRFGPLPPEAKNLLWLIRIKQLLKTNGIDALTVGPEKVALVSGPHSKLDPARAIALISAYPDRYQLTPDSKFVAALAAASMRDLFFGLEKLFQSLSRPPANARS